MRRLSSSIHRRRSLTGGATPTAGFAPGASRPAIVDTDLHQVLNSVARAHALLNSVSGSFIGGHDKEEWFSGTAVLSCKPTDRLLTYASYSRGYKAGGFNLDRSALGQPIFAPTDPHQFAAARPVSIGRPAFDPEIVALEAASMTGAAST